MTRLNENQWELFRYRFLPILIITIILGLLIPAPTMAAQNHFSKARPEFESYRTSAFNISNTNNATVFDIVISLYSDPDGDEDPDNNLADEDQVKYENIIRRWADSVYEQSNGGHKLGKVRIFRDGKQAAKADVVWNAREWPRANISGFGTDGSRITFGDIFPDGNGPGNDYDMLANPEGAGYTLGHEWGHYVYGLYDEYVGNSTGGSITSPRSGDTAPDDAIMNSQWQAVGGNFDWLNHSTSDNYEANTAQGRAYGASCWEVLVRDNSADARGGGRTALPKRTHYTALDTKAPAAADNWIKSELPAGQATGRSSLKIIWMQEDIEMQIVIDRSGSMGGTPIGNAKQAARSLVDTVQIGKTALGVVTFQSSVSQDYAITAIPDPDTGIKAAVQGVIDSIGAGGSTAMYDGASLALTNLLSYQSTNSTSANQVVFLLSDGGDNASSQTQSSITSAYQAADVPLITFGYGSGAPGGVLRELADNTGGLFFSSPTTLSEIQSAFLAANAAISDAATLASGSTNAPSSGGTATQAFQVDSTIESLTVVASYAGNLGDAVLTLLDPSGTDTGITFTESFSGTAVSAVATVDETDLANGGTGSWTVEIVNSSGSDLDVTTNVIGNPSSGQTYDVTMGIQGGSTVTYPDPIVVTATISKGLPITGVNMTATVTDPSNTVSSINMNDAGTDGDALASDGIYSAIIGYTANGPHSFNVTVDNSTLLAKFTMASFQPTHFFSANVNGELPSAPNLPTISENFSRSASKQVTVASLLPDDHGNTSSSATALTPDNTDVAGRIDSAGDSDYFVINGIDLTQDIVVRVTDLAVNMDPVLTIYAADGITQIATGDITTAVSDSGYVFLTVAAADIDPTGTLFAEVKHASASASEGNYIINAGAAIFSDQQGIDTAGDPDPTPSSGSSGGGGCLIDLLLNQ